MERVERGGSRCGWREVLPSLKPVDWEADSEQPGSLLLHCRKVGRVG